MNERESRRQARLQIDYTDLMNLSGRSDLIKIRPLESLPGWPPEKYLVIFSCIGFASLRDAEVPIPSEHHEMELYLSRDYPGKEPSLLWLTDIWHPNIDHKEPRHVCTNAVQTFYAQKPLSELVYSIAEMVQYKRYHAKLEAPYPLDLEVARWVRDVAEKKGWVGPDKPVDPRPLLRELGIRTRRTTHSSLDVRPPPASHHRNIASGIAVEDVAPAVVPRSGSRIILGKPSIPSEIHKAGIRLGKQRQDE